MAARLVRLERVRAAKLDGVVVVVDCNDSDPRDVQRQIEAARAIGATVVVIKRLSRAPHSQEGTTSGTAVFVGTIQAVHLGKDKFQMSYDVTGVAVSDTGEGLLHGSSLRCVGGMFVVNGAFDNETNSCVYTRPDGDQIFTTSKVSGKQGVAAKGTANIIGRTGKMAGITGSSEFTRTSVRPLAEHGSLSYVRSKTTYKLP